MWGDYRISSVSVRNPDGSDAVDLRYRSYEIVPGKYDIPGLPALYGNPEDADTLKITLKDPVTGLRGGAVLQCVGKAGHYHQKRPVL